MVGLESPGQVCSGMCPGGSARNCARPGVLALGLVSDRRCREREDLKSLYLWATEAASRCTSDSARGSRPWGHSAGVGGGAGRGGRLSIWLSELQSGPAQIPGDCAQLQGRVGTRRFLPPTAMGGLELGTWTHRCAKTSARDISEVTALVQTLCCNPLRQNL